jgi:UDP-glucose 4-epimerase
VVLTAPVSWDDPHRAAGNLKAGVQQLRACTAGGPWNVIWVAGAGVVGTSQSELAQEHEQFVGLLEALGDTPPDGPGTIFLASSAGGVYAGSSGPPYTEHSEPLPLAPYGFNKLRMEATVLEFAEQQRLSVVIGRIANLYGPGQNLSKPQGLISQLARAHLLRQPLSLYVSADTTRDYLYVGDCAEMVLSTLETATAHPDAARRVMIKILASEAPTTIAAVLAEFQRLVKRRLPVILADSPNRRFQVRDLRLKSVMSPYLRRHARTTLAAGIDATVGDLARQVRRGELRR